MQCKSCTLEDKLRMYNSLTSNAPVSLWLYQPGYEDVSNKYAAGLNNGQIKQGRSYKPASERIYRELGVGYALRVETDNQGDLSKVLVFDYNKGELFEYSPNELKELASVVKQAYSKTDKASISSLVSNVRRKLTKSGDLKNKELSLLNVCYNGNKAYLFYAVEDEDNDSIKKQHDDKTKTGRDEIRKSIYEMQQRKIEEERPKDSGIYEAIRAGIAEPTVNPAKAVIVDPKDSISYSYMNSGLIVVEVEQKMENKFRLAMVNGAFKNDLHNQINLYKNKDKQLEYKRMQQLQVA